VRRDLNIRLILMYHKSCFTFAETGFARPARHRSRSGEAGGLIVVILSKKFPDMSGLSSIKR